MLIKIPFGAEPDLIARVLRIAKKRQGTTKRVLPGLAREALTKFADREEKERGLEPITKEEVDTLVKDAPRTQWK